MKRTIFFVTGVLLIMGFAEGAWAQTAVEPQLILTWQAYSFRPFSYSGKTLPAAGTPIAVALAAVRNGQFLDLTRAKISWYLDGEFEAGGVNLAEFRFSARATARGYHLVSVAVKNESGTFESAITVPVVSPEVVVESPAISSFASPLSEFVVRAIPYFFNVKSTADLKFAWQVNGVWRATRAGENRIALKLGEISAASPDTLTLKASIVNAGNELEFGMGEANISLQKP
ncbi:MAG: hypothetical protein HYU81_01750 [Candidatus Brennerbacteria bacterium]|nr:hypothetical protein [Candidatus Brennerbacteria bacterium]